MQRAQLQLQSAQAAKAAQYAATDLADAEQHFTAAQAAMAAQEYASAQDDAEAAQVTARLAQVRAELAVANHEINQRSAENVRLRRQLLTAHTTPASGGTSPTPPAAGAPAAGFTPMPNADAGTSTGSGAGGATKEQP